MITTYHCTVIANIFAKPEIVIIKAKNKNEAKKKVLDYYMKENRFLVARIEVYNEEEYEVYRAFLKKHNFVFPIKELK